MICKSQYALLPVLLQTKRLPYMLWHTSIFFIYLYQSYYYKVDLKRINEFGQGGEDDDKPAAAAAGGEDEGKPSSSSTGGATKAHSTAASVHTEKGKVTKRQIT